MHLICLQMLARFLLIVGPQPIVFLPWPFSEKQANSENVVVYNLKRLLRD